MGVLIPTMRIMVVCWGWQAGAEQPNLHHDEQHICNECRDTSGEGGDDGVPRH